MALHSGIQDGCRQFRLSNHFNRRQVLQLGGLAGLGLSLPELLKQRTQAAENGNATFGKAKQVILLYLHGGHPQQETFDPKTHGPSEVRGEFGAISTRVPGIQFCELLPQTAEIAHHLAVIRSLTHENPNHVQASLPANTGHKHPPEVRKRGDFPPSEKDFPPFGAVLNHLRPTQSSLPTWVRVGPLMRRNNGTVLHGQVPGFLGAGHAPFVVNQELLPDDVQIEAVNPAEELSTVRLTARQDLLKQIDEHRKLAEEVAQARELDTFYKRAFDLLSGSETRRAFDLADESQTTRRRYGKTEFGQRCLLARRLAEAGVPMVNVSYCHTPRGSWDTHSRNFKKMKQDLAPNFDTAFTALVEDLHQRGRLDDTLVIATAEFGRTPKINKNSGRDHWPWVYSVAMAGAGVQAGTVYGASDASAAYPAQNPHGPEDFAATLYHLLGIPPETKLDDAAGRPHPLIIGRPIDGILG